MSTSTSSDSLQQADAGGAKGLNQLSADRLTRISLHICRPRHFHPAKVGPHTRQKATRPLSNPTGDESYVPPDSASVSVIA